MGASTKNNILVIDDDLVIRRLLNTVLSSSGHDVDLVESCSSGLQRLKTKSYDLITLDVNMPEMNGLSLYSRIREEWPGLEKKVLFVTGDMSNETKSFFIQNDCRHLPKPFRMHDLLDNIGIILKNERNVPVSHSFID